MRVSISESSGSTKVIIEAGVKKGEGKAEGGGRVCEMETDEIAVRA